MSLFVFFFTLFIYLITLTPSVGLHDSGDMTTACWVLGICHPTGYPFYTIFGKVWSSLIPIGNIAFKMNFLSSIFASLCVFFVYSLILKVTEKKTPAIVGSLILAFTTRFWEQAVIAEKYTLNGLFFALITYLLIKRKWLLLTFFLGLSFTHHTQTMFLIPGIIFFIIATILRKRKKPKKPSKSPSLLLTPYSLLPILFILPLFLWLYLPIRATENPPLNWNIPKDFFGFKQHITGFGYTGLFSLPSFAKVLEHFTNRIFPLFLSQLTLVSIIPALIGFFLSFKRYPIFLVFTILVISFNIYMAIGYNIPNIEDYYIVSFIYISIFAGICVSFFPKRLSFLFLFIPLILLLTHFNYCNRKDYYIIHDHGLNLIDSLDKDSVSLYTMDYNIFPLWYLLYVEERRRDISPVLYPYFHQDWALYSLLQDKPYLNMDKSPSRDQPLSLLDAILKRRFETLVLNNPNTPVYLDFKGAIPQGFIHIPSGFVYRIALFSDIEKHLRKEVFFKTRRLEKIKEGRLKGIIAEYSKAYRERGELYNILGKYEKSLSSYLKAIEIEKNNPFLYTELGKTYAILERYNEAEKALNTALSIKPDYADAYSLLGIIYFKMNKREMAISSLERALKIDPAHKEAKRNLLVIQK